MDWGRRNFDAGSSAHLHDVDLDPQSSPTGVRLSLGRWYLNCFSDLHELPEFDGSAPGGAADRPGGAPVLFCLQFVESHGPRLALRDRGG